MFRPYPCEKWEDEVIFAVEKVTSEYRQTGAPKVPKRAVGPTSLSMKEFCPEFSFYFLDLLIISSSS